jgi:hypothetical protein
VRESDENISYAWCNQMKDERLLDAIKQKCKSTTSETRINDANHLLKVLKAPSLWVIMNDPERFYSDLTELYPNIHTRKNKVSTILRLFSASELDKKGTKKTKEKREEWAKRLEELSEESLSNLKKNKMPEKYKGRIVNVAEVHKKAEELIEDGGSESTLSSSLSRLLIVILSDIKPKRADLGAVKIVSYKEECTDPLQNYLIFDKAVMKATLLMQRYKTDKSYGVLEEELSPRCTSILDESLKAHPRQWLFVDTKYKRPYKNNTIYSQFVFRTFERYFDRKFGSSLWRHVYASQAIDGNQPEIEREEIARLMAHNTEQNMRYRWADIMKVS